MKHRVLRCVIIVAVIPLFCNHLLSSRLPRTFLKKAAANIIPTQGFGRTHFIHKFPIQAMQQLGPIRNFSTSTKDSQVIGKPLFSPDDNVRLELRSLIENERKEIKMAAYILNDEAIADELIKASNRGVKIEIIADGTMVGRFSEISRLKEHPEIVVYEYGPNKKAFSPPLMHNKFIICLDNTFESQDKKGRSLLWTGSCNFTKKAYKTNQENAVILQGDAVNNYRKQFEKIRQRAEKHKKDNAKKTRKKNASRQRYKNKRVNKKN